MTVTNSSTLDAHADIAAQAYDNEDTPTGSVSSSFGTYTEIARDIDGALGFQARAFFNAETNDLVIAFAGTEGVSDIDLPEAVPDLVADLGLAVASASLQNPAAHAFIAHCKVQ